MAVITRTSALLAVSSSALLLAACGGDDVSETTQIEESPAAEERMADEDTGDMDMVMDDADEGMDDGDLTLAEATEGPSEVMVWQTGDEDTTVYMMGTVHILQPDVQWQNAAFEEAWAASDAVYFEADVTSPEAAAEIQRLVQENAFYTDGTTLASQFTEEEQAEINAALEPFGINLQALGTMKPWFASINVAQLALQKAGGDPRAGIDMILNAKAQADGKELRYLESIEDGLNALMSASDDAQAEMFLSGMEEMSDVEAYFARLVAAWYDGDAEELADLLSDGFEDLPELEEAVLFERSEDWAEKLDTLIEEDQGGTYFVAVGAGHLGGERSMQDALEGEGYDITIVTQ